MIPAGLKYTHTIALGVYNHVHNILRLFGGWVNFPFATSETKPDY